MTRSRLGSQTITRQARASLTVRPGFSLIDLLVSISIIAILIGIIAPSLSAIRESAKRVTCASNLRQISLGITMWSDDNKGALPYSRFPDSDPNPKHMMLLHVGEDDPNNWDGLGLLLNSEYINAPELFYCPSHTGYHPYERYEGAWRMLGEEIVGNFQFRHPGTNRIYLETLPSEFTLVSDGMRTQADFNHRIGANLLKADMSVTWFDDAAGYIVSILPSTDQNSHRGGVRNAWRRLDNGDSAHTPDELETLDQEEEEGSGLSGRTIRPHRR